MNNWKPISTAPQDQRSVLAANENSGICKVSWRRGIGSAEYLWGGPDSWKPTHWLPLPPSPEKTVPDAEGRA